LVSEDTAFTSVLEETAKGAFYLFSGGFIATALSALCGIIIARLLGPEDYGAYSLAFTIPFFLTVFTGFGVNSALTRYISSLYRGGRSSRIASIIRIGMIFTLLESIVVYLVGLLFIDWLSTWLINRPELSNPTLYLLPVVVFQAIVNASIGALLGFNDAKRVTYVSIIQQVFRLALAPLLIITGFGLIGALIGNTIAYALAVIPALIYLHHYYALVRDDDNVESGRLLLIQMITYGAPLYVSSVVSSLVDTYRNALLSRIADDYVIGSFNAAFRFVTLITIIMAPISTMLFPAFSRLSNNKAELGKLFTISVKYSSLVVVPAAVLCIVMPREIVAVLLGREYLALTPHYFALISLNYLYVAVGYMVLGSFFSGVGDTRVNLEATVVYAVVFAGLAVPLSGLIGVDGLAYSIVLANGASTIYSLVVARRKHGVSLDYYSTLGVFGAAVSSAIPAYILSTSIQVVGVLPNLLKIVIGGLAYLLIYATLLPKLGVINRGDLDFIVNAFSKIKPLKPLILLIAKYEEKLIKS